MNEGGEEERGECWTPKKGSATPRYQKRPQFENIFSTLNGQSLSFDKYMKIGKKPIIESELCKKCIVLN